MYLRIFICGYALEGGKQICHNFLTKRFQLKSRLSMAFQPSVDSFGIRRLGFKCSWWHRRQANDAVNSEQGIFSKNHDYKSFFPCRAEHVCTYISGARCAWWQKTTNRHRHTHETTTVTLAAHAH